MAEYTVFGGWANFNTGYDIICTIGNDAGYGNYFATIELRDSNNIYDINNNIDNFSVYEVPDINGPMPWNMLGNTFSQPNVNMQNGLDSLEWYGSGDVNLDGNINELDLQEMNTGTVNNMADCDGDGTPSTQNDKNVLTEYLDGIRLYFREIGIIYKHLKSVKIG